MIQNLKNNHVCCPVYNIHMFKIYLLELCSFICSLILYVKYIIYTCSLILYVNVQDKLARAMLFHLDNGAMLKIYLIC
jgi:hypothetical protein